MRPLRTRLDEARRRLGIPWEILERDYLLSWILAGIGHVESLRETLVFKGGTALKKCYFGDYRFSEDLDFSWVGKVPTGDAMERSIREACDSAATMLDQYAPVEILCERYTRNEPHPGRQEAFTVRARLPWQKQPLTRMMIETALDEKLFKPVQIQKINHEYGEPLEAQIQVYSLEEIVAEKLRAILQHAQTLEERGWSRSRARDYYDLWRVLGTYRKRTDLSNFVPFLREKCAVRNVSFKGSEDFFPGTMMSYVEKTWQQWLGPLVPRLPSFETVIGELRPKIDALIPPAHNSARHAGQAPAGAHGSLLPQSDGPTDRPAPEAAARHGPKPPLQSPEIAEESVGVFGVPLPFRIERRQPPTSDG